MNKSELTASVADQLNTPKAEVERIVNAFLDSVGDALAGGDKVGLLGFGTFQVSNRAARTGRNPQTGAKIDIPASKSVRFSPGTQLKRKVND